MHHDLCDAHVLLQSDHELLETRSHSGTRNPTSAYEVSEFAAVHVLQRLAPPISNLPDNEFSGDAGERAREVDHLIHNGPVCEDVSVCVV